MGSITRAGEDVGTDLDPFSPGIRDLGLICLPYRRARPPAPANDDDVVFHAFTLNVSAII